MNFIHQRRSKRCVVTTLKLNPLLVHPFRTTFNCYTLFRTHVVMVVSLHIPVLSLHRLLV